MEYGQVTAPGSRARSAAPQFENWRHPYNLIGVNPEGGSDIRPVMLRIFT